MREFLRFKKRLKCSDGIKATVQQNILSSFHQSIGGTMDKFLELIAEDIEFGAIEILKDTCETRREDQLVLPSASQEKHQVISPTTAHRQEVLPQIDNLCNFLDSTENVSINSSEAIVSSNSTNKLWTKKEKTRHIIPLHRKASVQAHNFHKDVEETRRKLGTAV